MTSSGFAMPPDQKASQIRSTFAFISPVITASKGTGSGEGEVVGARRASPRCSHVEATLVEESLRISACYGIQMIAYLLTVARGATRACWCGRLLRQDVTRDRSV
jgi:hypothetical protein